jgi:hypothetical protein
MQGVVNRRERHAETRDIGLGVQIFRRNVAMPFAEENAAQLDALSGRSEPSLVEPCGHIIAKGKVSGRRRFLHGPIIVRAMN